MTDNYERELGAISTKVDRLEKDMSKFQEEFKTELRDFKNDFKSCTEKMGADLRNIFETMNKARGGLAVLLFLSGFTGTVFGVLGSLLVKTIPFLAMIGR